MVHGVHGRGHEYGDDVPEPLQVCALSVDHGCDRGYEYDHDHGDDDVHGHGYVQFGAVQKPSSGRSENLAIV